MRIKICLSLFFCLTSFASAKLLNIQTWKTDEGTPVYFVASPSVPMLNVAVEFRAGSSDDGHAYGLSTLTNALLVEGTQKLSSQEFSNQITQIGGDIDTNADKKNSIITLQTLTEPKLMNAALNLYHEAITQPGFREKAIDRIKQEIIAGQKAQLQDPASVADLVLSDNLFKGTPYAHNPLGTPVTIHAISKKQISDFYKTYYTQKNAAIFMVGDISETEAKALAESLLQSLPNGKRMPAIKLSAPTPESGIARITFPSNQTYIRLASLTLDPKQAERFPTILANYLLGGAGLTSLLTDVIREQHGLSYHVGSETSLISNAQTWIVSLQTKNSSAEKAIDLARKTIADFSQQGASTKQVQAAKAFLVRSLPLRFINNGQILGTLLYLHNNHLPTNYFDTFEQNINAVTNEKMIAITKQNLNPEKMITVSVGGGD